MYRSIGLFEGLTWTGGASMICKRLQERFGLDTHAHHRAIHAVTLPRWSYALSALLGLAYAVYVVVTKLMPGASRGPQTTA